VAVPFSIDWRAVVGGIVFLVALFVFALLAHYINWPSEPTDWRFVVTLAAIVAFLPMIVHTFVPMIAQTFTFLQQSRASIEAGPSRLKIDFSAAAAVATVSAAKLTENLVEPGVIINETSFKELNEAAQGATEQSVVVVDLEDGRAWYKTRLFALAGTAAIRRAPKSLVVIGQRGGQPLCVAGWIRPRDVVEAFTRANPRYDEVWKRGKRYLHLLQAQATEHDPQFPQGYKAAYDAVRSAVIMLILVDQLEVKNPVAADWMTLGEAGSMFDTWLVRDRLDLGEPQGEQVNAVMTAKGDIVIATREGQYAGLIDVPRAERELLRQLLVRPDPSS
jgi:hypothetical protein